MIYVLMYHRILKKEQISSQYDVDIEEFKYQMRFISRGNFNIITPQDIIKMSRKNKNKKYVMVTFDDGYLDNYENAFPVLKQLGIKATVFVATGWIDNRESFMQWAQLKEMNNNNIDIETHTNSHKFLNDLSEDEVKKEITDSKKIIEDKLGVSVEFLSCPGGRISENLIALCSDLGIKGVFTSIPGINDLSTNIYKRILISRATERKAFEEIFLKNDKDYFFSRLKYKAKDKFKKLVGNKLYYIIWKKFKKNV